MVSWAVEWTDGLIKHAVLFVVTLVSLYQLKMYAVNIYVY